MIRQEIQLISTGPSDAVVGRAQELMRQGAMITDPMFSITSNSQIDLIYQGRRLLIGDNDDGYKAYESVLEQASLPHIENDPLLGGHEVFVGEIPRDARTIPQIAFSKQSEAGMSAADVIKELGDCMGALASRAQVYPAAEDIPLKRVFVRRLEGGILLVPPIDFLPATERSRTLLIDKMRVELWTRFQKFGATAMFESFKEGLRL